MSQHNSELSTPNFQNKNISELRTQNSPLIILLGPTCVGKTGVSILIAEHLHAEIVSADSMQIYRHMDIGTAKPTAKERKRVRHHMIDIREPSETYSCGRYIEDVVPVIETILKRKKVPLIVGGTGFYIRAMTQGLFLAPDADWSLRKRLMSIENEEKGSLYNYLKVLDPQAYSRIMPSDLRRIIRALEVCMKSGKRISELQKELTEPLPYQFVKIGLMRDRAELYGLIEDRVDRMIENGFVEEVERIEQLHPSHIPMQAIGYKEIALYIRGEITLDKAILSVKRATKRYAKRQFSWFKKEESIQWIDVTGITDIHEISERVMVNLRDYHLNY